MRFWFKIAVFISFCGSTFGQSSDLLNRYVQTGLPVSNAIQEEKVDALVDRIATQPKKSDRQILRTAFNVTHRQVLKQYNQYASFGELFSSGSYDCLTATALYSILLSRLGFEHQIIETNFHIFLLVDSKEGQVLLESTDPIGGFEYQPERIKQRITTYLKDQNQLPAPGEPIVTYDIFEEVSQEELIGLLYYNQCVKAFNNQQWGNARVLLSKAKEFYRSPRITEMESVLIGTIAVLELEKSTQLQLDQLTTGQLASRH